MKVKRIAVTRTFLETLFSGKEQHYKIENPLPKDARIIHFAYVLPYDRLEIIIESEEFEEVSESDAIPWYHLIFTDLRERALLASPI